MPSEPAEMDLRVITRAVHEVSSGGVPYLLVFSRVPTAAVPAASRLRDELRDAGYNITNTMIRRYQSHQDAVALDRPIHLIGGRHSTARQAEHDMRALTHEISTTLHLPTTTPATENRRWWPFKNTSQ
jgi:hypothetical protein